MALSRRILLSTSGAAALASGVGVGAAQSPFPERGITLIVPYGAGGGTDVSARLLAKDIEPVLGRPVTVENRGGGGGWIGWGALAAARPDGYTIGYLNAPSFYQGYLDPKMGRKETLDSFTPLMNHVFDYNVWAVRADSPFKTLKSLIDATKAAPETVTITGYGPGSDDNVAILGVEAETGIKFIVTTHRSTAEGKTAVLGGHVQVLAANVSEVTEDSKSGRLRILGVMSPERSRFLSDAPTFKEQGYNQIWAVSRGIAAPAGLPKDVEATLTAALEKVVASEDHRKKAEQMSLETRPMKGNEYRRFLRDNEQSMKKLMGW